MLASFPRMWQREHKPAASRGSLAVNSRWNSTRCPHPEQRNSRYRPRQLSQRNVPRQGLLGGMAADLALHLIQVTLRRLIREIDRLA